MKIDITIDDESSPASEQQRMQDLNESIVGAKQQLNSSFHKIPDSADLRKKKVPFWKQPDSHRALINPGSEDEGEID